MYTVYVCITKSTPNVGLKYTDKLSPTFSGLLSEKPDDSLFFLDVGQPSKAESTGELASTQLQQYFIQLVEILDLWKHSKIQSCVNSLFWAAVQLDECSYSFQQSMFTLTCILHLI